MGAPRSAWEMFALASNPPGMGTKVIVALRLPEFKAQERSRRGCGRGDRLKYPVSRILGLDIGEKTIGVAMSDENGMMAFPRQTIQRGQGWRNDAAALRDMIRDNEIAEIVVGLPLMLDGAHGAQADKVVQFVTALRGSVRIPIIFQDERMTTREAQRLLREADRNEVERKRVVDSVAASLILQAYLDSRRTSSEP